MTLSPDIGSGPVAVAMSGGVDSSVVAALLREQGAQVVGFTMLVQEADSAEDARSVARHLGINHHAIDLRKAFADKVIGYFANAYAAGETPSPCVMCNRFIKFGALMEAAQAHGARAFATGHYARRVETPNGTHLCAGADLARDQSYFLFDLTQAQIDFLRFPLADYTKEETRALARRLHLPVAEKPDSQDICFVPHGDYLSVLRSLRPDALEPGWIVDAEGAVLGRHEGIASVTVGQRKGLNLGNRAGDRNEPLFVVGIDAPNRRVVVGPRAALARQEVFLRDINWLGDPVPAGGLPVTARLRSAQPAMPARFFADGKAEGRLVFEQPQYGVAKGQAGVIYHKDRVLGGGWISDAV